MVFVFMLSKEYGDLRANLGTMTLSRETLKS